MSRALVALLTWAKTRAKRLGSTLRVRVRAALRVSAHC